MAETVIFSVECTCTKPGEAVFVVGSHAALGDWKPSKALALSTTAESFPLWSCPAIRLPPGAAVEYKYIIRRETNTSDVKWEGFDGNRSVTASEASVVKANAVWDKAGDLRTSEATSIVAKENSSSNSCMPDISACLSVPKQAKPAFRFDQPVRGASTSESSPGCYLRVLVSRESYPEDRLVVCGESPSLGSWNPASAADLVRSDENHLEWTLRFLPQGVKPGTLFKYVLLRGGQPHWESCGNRRWPQGNVQAKKDIFDGGMLRESADDEELIIQWGSRNTPGDTVGGRNPSAVFHAFHWQFQEVGRRASEIAAMGFDAVQLSPAQRSIHGDQWWTRYQPVKYEELDGLGNENDLQSGCRACGAANMRVFGDLVFNHMKVVASCDEWRRAQNNHGHLEELKSRLDRELGPTFNRDDFQWPWFALEGDEWDGPRRMEGWGCGEWSELRGGSQKVVEVHKNHMLKLRSCGVSGFRFDAAKHMRPEHLAQYSSIDKDLFFFGEVLSIDPAMQGEYLKISGASEPWPTTDFLLGVWLRKFLEGGEEAVDFEASDWVRHLLEVEQGRKHSSPPRRLASARRSGLTAPLLARNSIRFARNHDTVCNDIPLYGLGKWQQDRAAVASAWLLAAHDGSVLLLADDVKASPLIRQALLFRCALRKRLTKLSLEEKRGVWTDIRAKRATNGAIPLSVCIVCKVKSKGGKQDVSIGCCILNPSPNEPIEFSGSTSLASLSQSRYFRSVSEGPRIAVDAHGRLQAPVIVAPSGGQFFLLEE